MAFCSILQPIFVDVESRWSAEHWCLEHWSLSGWSVDMHSWECLHEARDGILDISLKGHGNETDFLGFLQKLVSHESLTLPFRPFRFWLRIRGDIRIRKTTPRYYWYWESMTPRITDTRSRRLPASPIRRVGYWIFLKKTLFIDSPHQWYGESPTPRILESESRRLRVSLIRRVDDSAYRWVGESMTPRIGDTGSCYSNKKISLASIFSTLNG